MQTVEATPTAGPFPALKPHPRIRRRRVEVRREEGRKRLRILAGGLAFLSLLGAVWLTVRSPLLDVDRVIVEGAAYSTSAAVAEASGVGPGRAMGDVEERTVAERVEMLPWVQHAAVRRDWPGTVHISVVERAPVAVTRTSAGGWGMLDVTGRVLAWVPDRPATLPEVAGIPPAGEPASRIDAATWGLLRVAAAVPPSLLPRVAAITPVGREVELQLVDGGIARLGPADGAPEKIGVVEAIVGRVDPAAVATIDARFPSTAVLTRK
jgi:cell division protein FtsQ